MLIIGFICLVLIVRQAVARDATAVRAYYALQMATINGAKVGFLAATSRKMTSLSCSSLPR